MTSKPMEKSQTSQQTQEDIKDERMKKELRVLADYKTIIILDNSLSMLSCQATAISLASKIKANAMKFSTNVYLHNSFPGEEIKTQLDCIRFGPEEPSDELDDQDQKDKMDLTREEELVYKKAESENPNDKLNNHLPRYVKRLLNGHNIAKESTRINFIVITDGKFRFKGWKTLRSNLTETAMQTGEPKGKMRRIGFQFVQLGDSTTVREQFKMLDNKLPQDIVDTALLGDPANPTEHDYVKVLLGGIHTGVDKHGARGIHTFWFLRGKK
ncbi:hypothetical protein AX16_007789 [Volvariella volvacea WC 439]|nr:hypothetical protein AX16_007789 [Volvariella volvacea WC 439]